MKLTTLEMFVLHKDGVPIRVLAEKTGRDPKDVKNELRRYVAAERRRAEAGRCWPNPIEKP